MSQIDRTAWLDAVRQEDSFSRRRAILTLRRDLFDERWSLIRTVAWDKLRSNEVHAGQVIGGELRYGPKVELPALFARIADARSDLRLRQMAIGALDSAILDDPINSPDAPFLNAAVKVAELLVGIACTPEPALRLTAATALDYLASSCRPWFDPGEPPMAGIEGNRDWFGYIERVDVWRVLEDQAPVFLPMMFDDYDALRTLGARLAAQFPSLSSASLELLAKVVRNEQNDVTRNEFAIAYAVLLFNARQPIELPDVSLMRSTLILIEALRQYPNFDPRIEFELDTMRRTLGCDRLLVGPGWRAHVLLVESNARKAGFTEYVSHNPRPHF